MKKLFFLAPLLILFSCNPSTSPVKVSFQGKTQGTYYAVTYFDNTNRNFQASIDSILAAFDTVASVYLPQSIISKVNRNELNYIADTVFANILELSFLVSRKTDGAFDVTVGPLVNAWGFGFKKGEEITREVVDSLKKLVGYRKIQWQNNRLKKEKPNMMIDFNAIAQGYAVDVLCRFLQSKGIDNFLIDIGGEVRAKGHKSDGTPWMVGIEKPAKDKLDAQTVQMIVPLKNAAIATSGNYRKYYEKDGIRYSHTIDPHTGYPVSHSLLSVTVLAASGAIADAYATAFMVMGVDKSVEFIQKHQELEACFISAGEGESLDVLLTPGMKRLVEQE